MPLPRLGFRALLNLHYCLQEALLLFVKAPDRLLITDHHHGMLLSQLIYLRQPLNLKARSQQLLDELRFDQNERIGIFLRCPMTILHLLV